jgi:ATP-dependent RNA helicase DeaD
VPAALAPALRARGFQTLTPVQAAVLVPTAAGRDLQISSKTGSGKTVALGLALAPTLTNAAAGPTPGPRALIIVPTRELANQVAEELTWLYAGQRGVRVASVTGGTPLFRDRQVLAGRPALLVGTPGRLLDHLRSGQLDPSAVRELVLDEADQMLDLGFREDLEAILDSLPAERRTQLVSATFPEGILRLAERYQQDPLAIEGTRLGEANLDIQHEAYAVERSGRYGLLVDLLALQDAPRTLVFVERRAEALALAHRLEADGFAAQPLSGELSQSLRERTLAAFRAGQVRVLVATDVAARGLDVPDVAAVIHGSLPINAETYTHRAGRTGRAGKAGLSILFAPHYKRRDVERLARDARVRFQWRRSPDSAEVRAQVRARERARLAAELENALAAGPSAERLEEARALLAGREPAALVAALLERFASNTPGAAASGARTGAAGSVSAAADSGAAASDGAGPRHPVGERDEPGAQRPRAAVEGGVRFTINWGAARGATPPRLVASLCRRGRVRGFHIRAIEVYERHSTFEIHPAVAEQFEDFASRRDPRDPGILIQREE